MAAEVIKGAKKFEDKIIEYIENFRIVEYHLYNTFVNICITIPSHADNLLCILSFLYRPPLINLKLGCILYTLITFLFNFND